MPDVTIDDLTSKASPVDSDQFELQETAAGGSFKTTKAQFLAAIQALVDANTAANSGTVTVHSDVTNAGSGAIITTAERNKLAGIDAGAEANTSSNAGAGAQLALPKAGVNLPFRSIIGGTDIQVVQNANDLTINYNGSPGDVFGPASSVLNRIAVFDNTTGKLLADGGATIADLITPFSGPGTTGYVPDPGSSNNFFLRDDGTWSAVVGGGSYNETTKDGASISSGRSILEFRDTGDATVTVTDDAPGDRTIITVDATAGAGGGGVGAGTPFVVGDLVIVESDAGDGTIQTAGLNVAEIATQAELDAHTGDGTIHFADAPADDLDYVRNNNAWAVISSGGGILQGSWRYSNTTTAADPGSGRIRLDNVDISAATEVYVSQTQTDATDSRLFFQTADVGDDFFLQEKNDSDTYIEATITSKTDNGGWWTIGIGNVVTGADVTISNNADTLVAHQTAAGSIDHNGLAGRDTADAHPISAVTGLQAALDTKLAAIVEDTTPVLGGDLTLNGNGFVVSFSAAAGNTFAAGDIGYMNAAGDVVLADNSAESSAKGRLLMANEAIAGGATGEFMSLGETKGLSGLTAGSEYYVGTSGGITATAPTASGSVVRLIGYALSTSVFQFVPDDTWITLA